MIAAIYARKSTKQDVADAEKSVTRQVDGARAFAEARGWTVDESQVYVDDAVSGTEFGDRRPGLQRLLSALRPRPSFQVLIMSEASRLGREAIDTMKTVKTLREAGIRIFCYLEPGEKQELSLGTDLGTNVTMFLKAEIAADLVRSTSRRNQDKALRQAKAGHVAGGRVFGYRNVDVHNGHDAHGRPIKSHVVREINPFEAEVVRSIFRMKARGFGYRAIAIALNDERLPSPRSQQGRPRSWTPSTVRDVLFRSTYRGHLVWNRTRKRDLEFLHRRVTARPADQWVTLDDPTLRIVSDAEWDAAHAAIRSARALFEPGEGRRAAPPPAGTQAKYLLTNFARCGCCGGPMKVRSHKSGRSRKFYYACAWHLERGRTVCESRATLPLDDADAIVLETLLDDVLHAEVLEQAIARAVAIIVGEEDAQDDARRTRQALGKLERARDRLVEAIAQGGDLPALLAALQDHERRIASTRAALERQASAPVQERRSAAEVRAAMTELAGQWRSLMRADVEHARPVLSAMLADRVTFTPQGDGRWEMAGAGSLVGLFSGAVPGLLRGVASPPGSATSDEPAAGLLCPFRRTFRAA